MVKRWLRMMICATVLWIPACAPAATPVTPFPVTQEQSQPSLDKPPSPPVDEQITPLPTTGILIPQEEADMIFEKVRSTIAEQLGVAPEAINLIEMSPIEWPDGCLGLASPDEMCIQVITPGYRLLVEVNDNTLEVRTDQNGNQVRVNRGTMLPDVRESEREVPARCNTEGMTPFVDFTDGYCFAYPSDFIRDDRGLAAVYAQPKNPANPEEVVARLDVFSSPAISDTTLEQLVSEFRKQFEGPNSPVTLLQTQITLDGQPAEVLEPVPGRLSSRMVFALHNGWFYQLIFFPIDEPAVEADLNRLYEAVISTFTFIP
ncbi:MAG: hypothetical protein KatS3mg047_0065 [Bellilinea sp.]|nr:MAG: hypothetical protein KatS3mg047_0065 [Bellilinea sp.]